MLIGLDYIFNGGKLCKRDRLDRTYYVLHVSYLISYKQYKHCVYCVSLSALDRL